MPLVINFNHGLCLVVALLLGWTQGIKVVTGPSLNTFERTVSLDKGRKVNSNPDLPSSPLPPISDTWSSPSTLIFVGISHYRDQRCSSTLLNLFSKAKHPERLRIGIVQQIHTEADPFHCVDDFCAAHPKYCRNRNEQIRLLEFTHQMARGPNYARALQGTLLRDEEFCMQIDSHTDVVQDWDEKALKMWSSIGNEYGILSHQPADIAAAKSPPSKVVPHLCQATFKKGAIVNLPPVEALHLESPLLAPLYSAAFSFSKCHGERKVPSDPDLQMIFDADEFAKFARLWTHGYDVYTPIESIVFHDYTKAMTLLPGTMKRIDALGRQVNTNPNNNVNSPMEWLTRGRSNIFRRELFDRSMQRLGLLLGMDPLSQPADAVPLTRYGLGTKRSLSQLAEFTGIDFKKRRVFGDRCVALSWVPYRYDADPSVSSGDEWGLSAEALVAGGASVPLTGSGAVRVVSDALYTSAPQSSSGEGEVVLAGMSEDPTYRESNTHEEQLGLRVVNEEEEAEEAHIHRGGELWWIFQAVDTLVEDAINAAESRIGYQGYAHKAMKVVLVLAPAFCLVVYGAFWLVMGGTFNGPQKLFNSGLKRI